MSISLARQILGIKRGDRVSRAADPMHRAGTCSVSVFQFSTGSYNATDQHKIAGLNPTIAALQTVSGDKALIGVIGENSANDVHNVGAGGAVIIKGIQLVSTGSIEADGGDTVQLVLLRRRSRYNCGSVYMGTGETAVISDSDVTGATGSIAYDLERIEASIITSGTITASGSRTRFLRDLSLFAQEGDILALATGSTVVVGAQTLSIAIEYVRLTPGGRVIGLDEIL